MLHANRNPVGEATPRQSVNPRTGTARFIRWLSTWHSDAALYDIYPPILHEGKHTRYRHVIVSHIVNEAGRDEVMIFAAGSSTATKPVHNDYQPIKTLYGVTTAADALALLGYSTVTRVPAHERLAQSLRDWGEPSQ